jgi:iron complex transport system substrate-binding protein
MMVGSRKASGNRRSGWRIAAPLAGLVWLGACNLTVPSDSPADRTIGARPTLVSLNPCIDAILVEIAPRTQVLALSHYSRDPGTSSIPQASRRGYEFTGGTAEEVLSAAPDLVLASTFIDPATRSAFENLGLRVETFGSPVNLEESIAQVRTVAAMTGNVAAGERLAAAMQDAAQAKQGERPITALLWQPGQIVPGEATLIADLLRRQGFVSHSAARGLGQADFVSLETLLAEPPELVLVAGDSAGQRHPLLGKLQDTRVADFPGWLINCGGPSVIAASTRLQAIRAGLE